MSQRDGADQLDHPSLDHRRPRNYHARALIAVAALASIPACKPQPQLPLKTTDGAVATANLDAQIEDLERQIAQRAEVEQLGRMLLLRSTRVQLLGRVSDIEAMLAIGELAVEKWPDDPFAHIGRAHALTTAHLFAEAEAELERAAALGGSKASVKAAIDDHRATLYAATGRYDLALAAINRTGIRDTLHLGREAVILAELGQVLRAEELFVRAEEAYQETSPFVIAWVLLQHALLWERAGDQPRARTLYERARARLPQLYAANVGLARLLARSGEFSRAIELLRPLADHEDPEALVVLAGLLSDEEADAARAKADARYQALFEKLPATFADHAAQFWLRAGNRPALALTAAKKNLEARPTREAFELALLSAIAARDQTESCAIATRLEEKRELARVLAPLAAAALESCKK